MMILSAEYYNKKIRNNNYSFLNIKYILMPNYLEDI